MAYKMTSDRIAKTQCAFCGSRSKKLVEIFSSDKTMIGKSMVCCNCGHVDNFAETLDGIYVFASAQRASVKQVNVVCGLSDETRKRCNLEHCDIGYFDTYEDEPVIVQDKTYPECPPPAPHTPPEFTVSPKPATTAIPIKTDGMSKFLNRDNIEKEIQAMTMAEANPRQEYERSIDTHADEVRVLQALPVNEKAEEEKLAEFSTKALNDDSNYTVMSDSRVLSPKPTSNSTNNMVITPMRVGPRYN